MTSNKPSQVVVGYDLSNSGRAALERAITLAVRAPFHVLHFVRVLDTRSSYEDADKQHDEVAELVGQQLRIANASDRIHFFVHARIGKAADEILAVAREVGADLIIVGTKGLTGVERMMLGSVAEKVVREAGCTVEVARPRAYPNVELLDVKDTTQPPHPYHQPHRYAYESSQVQLRPTEWPLY
jgi:nucleotide-binding universal stress UspA family protein